MEVFCVPTASSRWYSWLRSSPSTATCAPLERVPAKSASLPKATHRCHSERDSQDPASFFQDVLVASEKIAMLVALAAFLSASLPIKPIRVILFRYIHTFLLVLPVCLGHGKASGRGSPGKKLHFWGDRNGGTRTGKVREQKQKLRSRRAPQKPRSSAETNGQDRERNRTDH